MTTVKVGVTGIYTIDFAGRMKPINALFVLYSIIVSSAHPYHAKQYLDWISTHIEE